MGKIVLSLFVLLFLVACSGPDAVDVSPLPTEASVAVPGPRAAATTASGLPATWTPVPVTEGDHLPASLTETVAQESESTEGLITYVVQSGDTLGEIAAKYGVTLAALADQNSIRNWDVIEVGTVLVIPGG